MQLRERNPLMINKSARYGVLVVLSALFLLPFFWMLLTSLTPRSAILSAGFELPKRWEFANYPAALTTLPFGLFLRNSLIVTMLAVTGQTISALFVAFGFSRLQFKGRDVCFGLALGTLMLPWQVVMVPEFILFAKLRWIDTFWPLILPFWLGGSAFYIFLLRQFFLTLPRDLEEAAMLDGCGALGILRNVVVPSSKPALVTVVVFSFMAHWNDFLRPLIYLQSTENKTLSLGLFSFKTLHGTEYQLMMAASVCILLPVALLFFFTQRYFVEGIVTTGLKG